MRFELTGKLEEKFDTVQISATFKKKEFVLLTTEEGGNRVFENHIKFQLVQDRTSMLDGINPGDTIKVHFNIRGNRFEKDGKVSYFTNLEAWRIETEAAGGSVRSEPTREKVSEFTPDPEPGDDLPF